MRRKLTFSLTPQISKEEKKEKENKEKQQPLQAAHTCTGVQSPGHLHQAV